MSESSANGSIQATRIEHAPPEHIPPGSPFPVHVLETTALGDQSTLLPDEASPFSLESLALQVEQLATQLQSMRRVVQHLHTAIPARAAAANVLPSLGGGAPSPRQDLPPVSSTTPLLPSGPADETWAVLKKLTDIPVLVPHRQTAQHNVLTWISQVQYNLELHRLGPHLWVIAALQFLSKDIRAHYEITYSPEQLRAMPWLEFTRQLRERYLPPDMGARLAGALDDLQQAPEEALSRFVIRTKALVRQLRSLPGGAEFAGDGVVAQRFIRGIRSSTVRTLIRAWLADKPDPIDLELLLEYALKLCSQQDMSIRSERRLAHVGTATPPRKSRKSKSSGPSRGRSPTPPTSGKPAGDSTSKDVTRCTNCGRKGHESTHCRRARRGNSPEPLDQQSDNGLRPGGRRGSREQHARHGHLSQARSRRRSRSPDWESGDETQILPDAADEIVLAESTDDEDWSRTSSRPHRESSRARGKSQPAASRVRFDRDGGEAAHRASSPSGSGSSA
mmetsp:Transcript_34004/g.76537  ORF Transcript_34004/g.76537 Transcript_34004/m.76537 type:complete len:505 (-) Transcript_34004:2074-3588(-)